MLFQSYNFYTLKLVNNYIFLFLIFQFPETESPATINCCSSDTPPVEVEDSYSDIIKKIQTVTLPLLWTYTVKEDLGLAFLKWNETYFGDLEKKITIDKNLSVKVCS